MLMATFTIGQFVHLDGSGRGVVVMLPNKTDVPDEHVGVWFGTTTQTGSPVICTVPPNTSSLRLPPQYNTETRRTNRLHPSPRSGAFEMEAVTPRLGERNRSRCQNRHARLPCRE